MFVIYKEGTILSEKIQESQRRARLQLNDIANALSHHALTRADNPLPLRYQQRIPPRLLTLPCPDNAGSPPHGDGQINGTENSPCGKGTNPSILHSGSRFGILPWQRKFIFTIGNVPARPPRVIGGLGQPFADSTGNNYWYAIAFNVAPREKQTEPLNLHRLANISGGWLTINVVQNHGNYAFVSTLSRIAAVMIAPGIGRGARIAPDILATMSIQYNDPRVVASLSLDRITVTAISYALAGAATVTTIATTTMRLENDDNDRKFVRAPRRGDFNDEISFLGAEEWWREGGEFAEEYKRKAGVSDIQNLPLPGTPLAKMQAMVSAYYHFLEFYPVPAKRDEPSHINGVRRHCAAFHSGGERATAIAAPGLELFAAGTVTAIAGVLSDAAFLAQNTAALSPLASLTIMRNDDAAAVGGNITVARYARLTVISVAIVAPVTFTVAGTVTATLPAFVTVAAGATITLASTATILLPEQTPLASPNRFYAGWLPSHYKTTMTVRTGNITTQISTKAAFLSPTRITTSGGNTFVFGGNATSVFIPENSRIKRTDNYSVVSKNSGRLSFVFTDSSGATVSVNNATPDALSYEKRQFAIFFLSDGLRTNSSIAVTAPAVVYPWRKQTKSNAPLSRDTLHPYPPCLDSRNYYDGGFDDSITLSLSGKVWVNAASVTVTSALEIPVAASVAAGRILTLNPRPVLVEDNSSLTVNFSVSFNARRDAFRAFMADHPIHYAVAGGCMYGGDCAGGGLTVVIAASATVALPEPLTVTENAGGFVYNESDGDIHNITVSAGGGVSVFPSAASVIAASGVLATAEAGIRLREVVAHGRHSAWITVTNFITTNISRSSWLTIAGTLATMRARLLPGQNIANGAAGFTLSAGTPIVAVGDMTVTAVRALMAFSPSPLSRAQCASGAALATVIRATTISGGTVVTATVADQTSLSTSDLVNLCAWLDDEENNDGDETYRIAPPSFYRYPLSRANDFFILFGGRPVL